MSSRTRIYWRCFHCDATFTKGQAKAACDHFGHDSTAQPVCLIRSAGEGAFVSALRSAESQAASYLAALEQQRIAPPVPADREGGR